MKGCFKVWLTVLALAIITMATQPTRAAGPWYVAPGGDDGNDCLSTTTACATINGALGKADPDDTIYVATGTYTSTSDEVVLLNKNATFSGGWDGTFTTQSGTSTIDGEDARRGITVNSGVTAIVERFVVENGSSSDGGGIYNNGGTVTLTNSTVSGNTGSHMGAGIYNWGNVTLNNSTVSGNTATWNNGGGIYNPGTLTLNNSTVSGNATDSAGGGIHNTGTVTLTNSTVSGNTAAMSGGIYNQGTVTLNSSTVSGNTAIAFGWGGGGIYNNEWGTVTLTNSTVSGNTAFNYGGIYNGGRLTMTNSIVSGNTAINIVGGISNDGGTLTLINSAVSDNAGGLGIYNWHGTLTLDNSAVSGNTATGIFNWGTMTLTNSAVSGNTGTGIDSNYGTVTLDNSTISGNTGGGIYIYAGTLSLNSSTVRGNTTDTEGGGIYNGGTVTLQNTILAGNMASGTGPDCYGTIDSSGYNLIGDTSGCTFTPTDGDLTNIDAQLGSLEGSPGYHPLLPGSPAINAGNPDGCMGSAGLLTTDQRGAPRVGRCDIGAYEAGLAATKQVIGSPGDLLTYKIILSNDEGSINLTNVSLTDTLPISVTYVADSFSATNGTGGESGGVITWSGTVFASTDTTISFSAVISDEVPPCSVIANTAVINQGGSYEFERRVEMMPCQICNVTKHADNPVLSIGAEGRWDDDGVWGPAVLKEGSSYKMWYTGYDGVTSRIGYAISPDGINWTKEAANPVLSPSESWEMEGIRAASVISDSGLYKMWYTGLDSDGVSRIGYATSSEGVTWTKDEGNPVLDVGAAGSWEDDSVSGPTVIKEGIIYYIWYTGDDGITPRIGHATSINGINWIKDLANPVLDIGPPGGWDWLYVYGPSVVAYNDVYLLWYSGGTLPEAWQTGYALSSNGSDWTRQEMLIPEGAPGTFDADGADYPSVIVDGSEFKVWYSGLDDGGTYNIGYATAEICSEPSPAPPVPPIYLPIVMKDAGAQPSCLAYYTDDFSDPDSGWPVGDDSNYTFGYISNQYQIQVKTPPGGFQVTPGAKATDFVAAVSARRTSGTYGAYGIHFGINEDWSQYYEVVIDANYYSIWRYDGTWTPLRDWTTSGHINTGTSWNRLKVIRDGASIAFYVNNQHLATVADSSFTGLRRIGLYAGSDRAFDARFDDFSLYPASCGADAAGVGFEMGEPGVHEVPVLPGLDQSP